MSQRTQYLHQEETGMHKRVLVKSDKRKKYRKRKWH